MIDKYFKFFIKSKLQKYINNIVDDEVKKSLTMELNIKDEDIKREKSVLYFAFKNKVQDIKLADDYNYSLIVREIHNQISDKLAPQLKYYFDNSKEGEVKNKYNCHLNSVVSRIMMDISNNKISF